MNDGCSCGSADCAGSHSLYWVKDSVWNQAAKVLDNSEVTKSKWFGGIMSGDGHLHPACLERILGRELTRKDFVKNDPLNAEKDLGRKL